MTKQQVIKGLFFEYKERKSEMDEKNIEQAAPVQAIEEQPLEPAAEKGAEEPKLEPDKTEPEKAAPEKAEPEPKTAEKTEPEPEKAEPEKTEPEKPTSEALSAKEAEAELKLALADMGVSKEKRTYALRMLDKEGISGSAEAERRVEELMQAVPELFAKPGGIGTGGDFARKQESADEAARQAFAKALI